MNEISATGGYLNNGPLPWKCEHCGAIVDQAFHVCPNFSASVAWVPISQASRLTVPNNVSFSPLEIRVMELERRVKELEDRGSKEDGE